MFDKKKIQTLAFSCLIAVALVSVNFHLYGDDFTEFVEYQQALLLAEPQTKLSLFSQQYNIMEFPRVIAQYSSLTSVLPQASAQLPEANAQIYNVTVRGETSETVMLNEKRGITKLGLPQHVLDNSGNWVKNIFNEDSNGVQVESGSATYWFSKSSCSLTQYENGRITDDSYIVIKSNNWVVKVAQNGTDNWSDVSQNSLPCTVTTETIGNHFILNSTKSDVNGTISEIYDYKLYSGLKQTVYFTNNDPSLTDHKFSFSNILQDTPKSFSFDALSNGNLTSHMYSIYAPENQPAYFGGQGTVINFTNGDVIQFDYDMLFDNGTAVTETFTWFDERVGFLGYGFQTAIDQLWAVKFLPQSDQTMDIYIDYAKIDSPLAVGETMELDPIFKFENWDYLRIRSTTGIGTSFNCNSASFNTNGVDTVLQARISTGSSSQESCFVPFFLFDITDIPDDATALVTHFQWNVTSNTNSAFSFFTGGGDVVSVLNDNIFTLSFDQIADVLFRNDPSGVKGSQHFDVGSTFRQAGTYVGIKSDTNSLPSDLSNIEFTEQLATGRNFYQLAIGGFSFSTTFGSGSANANFVTDGTYFQVEWEILSPADAPFNVTLEFTDSPDSCDLDWEAPSDLGGATAILGYQIKRNTGGIDQILVADTGNALPTSFSDTTIVGGVSHRYAVSAITSIGVGNFSAPVDSNGDIFSPNSPEFDPSQDPTAQGLQVPCGIPENPSDPILDTLSNTALGVVGLDYRPPLFTGNSPILGYKIERTLGTPTGTTDWHWAFMINDAPSVSNGVSQDSQFTNLDHQAGGFTQGTTWFFKTFDKDIIDDRDLKITWLGNGTIHRALVKMYDGEYLPSAGLSDFPPKAGCNGCAEFDPVIKDSGKLQFSTTKTSAFTLTTDTLFNIDTSGSTNLDDKVTIFVYYQDKESASVSTGSIRIDSIEIDGFGTWNFGTSDGATLSGNTPVTCTTFAPLNNDSCGEINAQFVAGDGFISIEDDTGTPATEFFDNTVEQLVLYGYRIFAINSEGLSPASNIKSITTAGIPEVPDTPNVVTTGTQTINIDWETPNLNSGNLVGYELERKVGTGGVFTTLESNIQDTFFLDGDGLFKLTPATQYCYRVQVETGVGESGFSGEACATTFDSPSKVQNLQVTALDGSTVIMSFETPASDGGSAITGFKVEQQISLGGFVVLEALTLDLSRNDTGLPIGSLIEYRVSASNQFGFGETETASATTDSTPQAPPNFTCSASSSTSITLSWNTPLTFSAPTGYQIDRALVGGAFSTIQANTANANTQFLDDGLAIDSTFRYRILGLTPEGNTDFSVEITCSTLTAPDGFPPENLRGEFTQTVPHQMVLAWDIPDTFGIPISEFRIERDDGAGYNEIATVSGSSFAFLDQNPANTVSQKYRIFTVGSLGDSPPAIVIPFTANQTSHWHYEKTISDSGKNKNTGMITGIANFNNTGINGLGLTFDGSTYITVGGEEDYDQDNNVSTGITTYYRGNSTGVTQALVTKANTFTSIGYSMFIDSTGVLGVRIINTVTVDELHVLGSTNVTDNSLHFLGFGYDGNGDESGLSLMVDGSFETKNVLANSLTNTILNDNDLTIGAYDDGSNTLTGILDDTRFFGSGTLDDATLEAVAENSISTVIPINATFSIQGSVFADISREVPVIIMTSGYPIPLINTIDLFNFTATNVNTQTPAILIDSATGIFTLDPTFFNVMSSLSNYTAISSLTNSQETFNLLSNFDIQVPVFTFSGDFFFQQQRNPTFNILSFNYTQTVIPFDLDCNFKSELFGNGTTVPFANVFFVQHLQPVDPAIDVVVACIDPNIPVADPSAPSFGGTNTILSFVSFGDTTGVGNFLQFTQNYGDFFGVGLPFLFIIILAAAFTGRSAPTGILIIAIAIGIMWAMGILVIDPFMWGIILVLVILGILGGKKFL